MTKVTINIPQFEQDTPKSGDYIVVTDTRGRLTFVRQIVSSANGTFATVNPENGNIVREANTIEKLLQTYDGYKITIAKEVKLEVK